MEKLKKIYDTFVASGQFVSATPYGSGHINDTYLVKVDEDVEYILQKINGNIFKDIPKLVQNKELVCGHIRNRLIRQKVSDITRKYITYFYSDKGKAYHKDYDGNYWTLSLFIKGSKSYDVIPDSQIAYQVGIGFGEFENRISDFDARLLTETIPLFHNVPRRQRELKEALAKANPERIEAGKELLEYLKKFDKEMLELQQLKDDGVLPLRVTHNDTKANNLLFDHNDHPLCVIDLDTVMPGIVHYDFGDAIRSACNTAGEETRNLNEVSFNIAYFEAFTAGFMEKAKHLFTLKEKRTLARGCTLMTYLQAVRFLTDYLDGDHYYPVTYPEHNLQRAKVQVHLLQDMEKQFDKMNQFILEQ
ncbi:MULTISPECIES: phosphotransferase enzyme family protein [Butyricimonas]|uniref:phosphotransferase enzyme family protein n=1 Tax=Butyricimonas TaxID=574697 RepID=UPI0007FB50AD|nr:MULTISPECIES: aminoglycoside phosphotransferase family protein [Butyricimonas]